MIFNEGLTKEFYDMSSKGYFHAAEYCLRMDLKININFQTEYKFTPLMISIFNKHYNIAHLLIDNGADLNIQNNSGNTALHIASDYEDLSIVEKLIKCGADTNIKNNVGYTLLHTVSSRNDKYQDIVKILINNSVNVNIRNYAGTYTPLTLALENYNLKIAKLLILAGAVLETKNDLKIFKRIEFEKLKCSSPKSLVFIVINSHSVINYLEDNFIKVILRNKSFYEDIINESKFIVKQSIILYPRE